MTSVAITVYESVAFSKESIEKVLPSSIDIKNRLLPIIKGNTVIFVEYQSTA